MNPHEILEDVAGEYGITVAQMQGRSRVQEFVRARAEASKRLLVSGYRVAEIGRLLGNRRSNAINYYLEYYGKRNTNKRSS